MTARTIDNDALDHSVVDCVIDYPEAIAVLARYGIDFSCGGKSLQQACLKAGVHPCQVLESINAVLQPSKEPAANRPNPRP